MNKATRITASVLGSYAGLLGIEHGYFEILQGNETPSGVLINAMGAPCQPNAVWHACFPALTVIPNLLVTGILAIITGLCMIIWAISFIQRRRSGLTLASLSLLLFLVGGGFVPALTGFFAAAATARINTPLHWRRMQLESILSLLAWLWPWTLGLLVIWIPGSWLLVHYYESAMLKLSLFLFFTFDVGLPLFILFTAISSDIHARLGTTTEAL